MSNKSIEHFSKSIIYVDWNIYSYLTGLSPISGDVQNRAKCFLLILNNFIDYEKYCLAFSFSHYRDILLGNEEYF